MNDFGYLIAVGSLLDDEDGELGVGFGQAAGDYTTGETTCAKCE